MDPIQALISGAPTDDDKLAAMSAALRKQNTIGQLAQLSGDRVLSPLGQNLSQQSLGTAQQLGEQRAQQERQKGLDLWKQQQLEMQRQQYADSNALREMQIAATADNRAATRDLADAKREDVNSRDLRNRTWKLSKEFESSGIASAAYPMRNLVEYMGNIPEGSLKGVGMTAVAEKELTQEGRYVRSLLQSVINPILLARSGAAVTDPEEKRLLRELGMGIIQTEEDFRKAIGLLSRTMGDQISNLYGGIGGTESDVAKAYIKGAGSGAITPDMFSMEPVGQQQATQSGGLTWEQAKAAGITEEEYAKAVENGYL